MESRGFVVGPSLGAGKAKNRPWCQGVGEPARKWWVPPDRAYSLVVLTKTCPTMVPKTMVSKKMVSKKIAPQPISRTEMACARTLTRKQCHPQRLCQPVDLPVGPASPLPDGHSTSTPDIPTAAPPGPRTHP